MPINARESLEMLISSEKLEGLVQAAKTKLAKYEKASAKPCTAKKASELEQKVDEATSLGHEAIKALKQAMDDRLVKRAEKVAIVRHLLQFGSRLQPA
jgi:hypothetical protein